VQVATTLFFLFNIIASASGDDFVFLVNTEKCCAAFLVTM